MKLGGANAESEQIAATAYQNEIALDIGYFKAKLEDRANILGVPLRIHARRVAEGLGAVIGFQMPESVFFVSKETTKRFEGNGTALAVDERPLRSLHPGNGVVRHRKMEWTPEMRAAAGRRMKKRQKQLQIARKKAARLKAA